MHFLGERTQLSLCSKSLQSSPTLPPMAPLSTPSGSSKDSATRVFDDIEATFHLDNDALHTITKQFLEDFRLGLSEYNHPMAMMYVFARIEYTIMSLCACSPTFVTGVPNGSETG